MGTKIPTVTIVNSELAVLIPDIPGEYGSPSLRDILLNRRSIPGDMENREHFLTRIQPDHALYSPLLHYVLFYPAGGRGRVGFTGGFAYSTRSYPHVCFSVSIFILDRHLFKVCTVAVHSFSCSLL
jgi:hypothetical protein